MIKTTSLNKYYNRGKSNEIHVINDVSVEFPDYGFVVILGKSGSGKTTLLNVLGGLDDTNGVIQYNDVAFDRYNMKQIDDFRNKNIGYVFQNYLILPEETVFQNVDTSLKLCGIQDTKERRKRADAALKAVGMAKFRRKYANSLSGGQKQRIGIARALAKLPKIVIADEPTGNLDSENSIEIMRILKEISQKYLVIMVTHNDNLAWSFGDRIINYSDGHIVSDVINTPEQRAKMQLGRPKSEELTLYLSDYEKHSVESAGVTGEIYRDKNATNTISFKIIERDGHQYLFVNDKDVIVNDHSIQIIDERPTVTHDEELGSSTFDSSNFEVLPHHHISFWSLFKSSFFGFFHEKHMKTGAFKVLSAILGVGLAAVSILSYFTFFTTDFSSFENAIDTNSISVSTVQEGSTTRKVNSSEFFGGYASGVTGIVTSVQINASSFGLKNLAGGSSSYSCATILVPSVNGDTPNVSYGKNPDGEYQLCLSTAAIDLAMPEYRSKGNSYESLIGKEFLSPSGKELFFNAKNVTPTIVGIVKNSKPFIYLGSESELSLYEAIVHTSSSGLSILNEVSFKTRAEASYTIPATEATSPDTVNVIASSAAEKYFNKGLSLDHSLFNVVGTFASDEVYAIFDSGTDFDNFKVNAGYEAFETTEFKEVPSDLEITWKEGYSSCDVDQYIVSSNNEGAYSSGEIVGTYASSDSNIGTIYTSFKTAISRNYSSIKNINGLYGDACELFTNKYKISVYSNNASATRSYFGSLPIAYSAVSTISALNEMNIATLADGSKIIPLAVCAGILVLMFAIVLLATRSNMIRHIYSISVFRSLGASRTDVHRMFIAKDLVSYLMTMFLGIFCTFLVAWIAIAAIGLYNVPFYIFLIAAVVAYGFSLLGTMIPLWSLLSKTPYQISTKYDI